MADKNKSEETGPVTSLAGLNARNRDFYKAPPLVQRRKDGTVIDELFPKKDPDKWHR